MKLTRSGAVEYLLAVIVSIIITGCSATDIESFVTNIPQIQQFLDENPDAEIKITYWASGEINQIISSINSQCGKEIQVTPIYRAIVKENGTSVTSWIKADDRQVLCVVREIDENIDQELNSTNETGINETNESNNVTANETSGNESVGVNGTDESVSFIVDTITEFEKKPNGKGVLFNGKEYLLEYGNVIKGGVFFNAWSSFSITINGKYFEDLTNGEIFQLDDGTYFGISRIRHSDFASDIPSTDFYLGNTELNFTPFGWDERLCTADEDCVKIKYACCKCNHIDKDHAINRIYLETYLNESSGFCLNYDRCESREESTNDHWTCSAEPQCINRTCNLVNKQTGGKYNR